MQFVLVAEPHERVDLPGDLVGAAVSLSGVNWSREVVVIIDMGEQRTGGYAVRVLGVNLIDANQVELTLEVTRPGPGSFVTQVLTHPYTVARIPRVGLRPGPITITAMDPAGAVIAEQVVQL